MLAWGLDLVPFDHLQLGGGEELWAQLPPPRPDAVSAFVEGARLRPFVEIHQTYDLLYCLHNAARQARLEQRTVPYDEQFVMERRQAISWLAGVEPDWDEQDDST